ncbi:MAG: InlB B-repeat-containing protein, partial [Bacteroidales bacterium]|nr:InlB B-repeat-containing protein [Bacteroidales bacterium]
MAAQTFEAGVSQAIKANTFTRSGYTFTGWNTNADGRGTSYTDKQS